MSAQENVLVIPATSYINDPGMSLSTLKQVISKQGMFLERAKAEVDPNYLQIIPYIVLRSGKQIFLYKRTKKGGEARLYDSYSIGVGGHVNDEDWDGVYGTPWSAVESCAYRELTDELEISDRTDGKISELVIDFTDNIIYDPSNDVGKVHLGIICTCDLSHRHVSVKETHKMEGNFTSMEKAQSHYDHLETWSQLALECL